MAMGRCCPLSCFSWVLAGSRIGRVGWDAAHNLLGGGLDGRYRFGLDQELLGSVLTRFLGGGEWALPEDGPLMKEVLEGTMLLVALGDTRAGSGPVAPRDTAHGV